MKWVEIERELASSGFRVFTHREFGAIAGASPSAAKFLLIRYTRRGLLCRLKRGLYAVRSRMPSRWGIANRLYRPSYISLSSALSYHGLIPESVYAVTSVTTRSTRQFEVDGVAYLYRTIKRAGFGGYRSVDMGGETVLLAEPAKALADHLYFVFLKKEVLNERLSLGRIGREMILERLGDFRHPGLLEWFRNDIKVPDRRALR